MSSASATQSNEYDFVSSFYGPGAVVGWELTALACVVSFSLHPRKRSRDSITADLIAVLTFPTVAAADLITQVRSYPKEGITLAQNAASIYATLFVADTFLTIDVVLLLLAAVFQCVRRACLLATVGLVCFSAECYMYFSPSVSQAIGQNHDTVFLVNLRNNLIGLMATLLIYIIFALSVIAVFICVPVHQPHARPSEREEEATRIDWERAVIRIHNGMELPIYTVLFVSSTFVAAVLPLFWEASVDLHSQPWLRIRTAVGWIAHRVVPMSNTSIKELDQAVALLTGATVLGFSLYSTADTHYQAWLSKTRVTTEQPGIELRTLDRNQASTHSRELFV